jgi:LPXTG-motif cell wall-anchored protein
MACHTRAVPGPRKIVSYLLLLGALALTVPAVTVASGGGSAGDQQYTDPFATQPGSGASHKSTKPSTTTTAPPAATSTAPAPAANTALSTSAKTLPYTGYDSWLAAGFGLVLAGAGLGLRRKAQRS